MSVTRDVTPQNLRDCRIECFVVQLTLFKAGVVKRIWLERIRAYFSSVLTVLVPFLLSIPNTHLIHERASTMRLHGKHPSIGGQYSSDLFSAREYAELENSSVARPC